MSDYIQTSVDSPVCDGKHLSMFYCSAKFETNSHFTELAVKYHITLALL